MVNNSSNISAYEGKAPTSNDKNRIISEVPLYNTARILEILKEGDENTIPWTRRCIQDIECLSLDKSDVRTLIKDAITNGTYKNSQWCTQKPAGPWAACDAYQLFRSEWVQYAKKNMRIEYYVKFAIGKTGKILLLVSCHT